MISGEMWGWIGGIAGGVIGLAGGIIGTYCSIKNTKGPRERAFMIKSAFACWVVVVLLLGLLLVLPAPYRWLVWIPYVILLPLTIHFGNRKLAQIRKEDLHAPRA